MFVKFLFHYTQPFIEDQKKTQAKSFPLSWNALFHFSPKSYFIGPFGVIPCHVSNPQPPLYSRNPTCCWSPHWWQHCATHVYNVATFFEGFPHFSKSSEVERTNFKRLIKESVFFSRLVGCKFWSFTSFDGLGGKSFV